MKIRLHSIWSILPVPVVTLKHMPGRLVGLCLGPLIVVREDYAADWPTIVHELTHCKQFWRGLAILHLLRYYSSRRYRLKAELEAFRAEIDACEPHQRRQRLHESSRALATSYSLGLDTDACRLLLSSELGPMPRRWQPDPFVGVVESVPTLVPTLVPARVERRANRPDRRATAARRDPAERRPEHNRRRQVDRRRSSGQVPARTHPHASHPPHEPAQQGEGRQHAPLRRSA